jgi:hypothetical protein
MRGKWYVVLTANVILLMFSGFVACAPTSTSAPATSKPADSKIGEKTSQILEQYFVKKEVATYREIGRIAGTALLEPATYRDVYMDLKTVARWQKDNLSQAGYYSIPFVATVPQWVVNCSYESRQFTNLDPIGSEATFDVSVFSEADYDKYFHSEDRWLLSTLLQGEYRGVSEKGVYCVVIQIPGNYVIVLNIADVTSWWVKVGINPTSIVTSSSPGISSLTNNLNLDAIIGKWQHGFSECPPSIDKKFCEKIKNLPENKPYYLEFSRNGRVSRTEDDQEFSGRYTFVGDTTMEIVWESGNKVVYDVKFSGDKMGLVGQGGMEETFRRVD